MAFEECQQGRANAFHRGASKRKEPGPERRKTVCAVNATIETMAGGMPGCCGVSSALREANFY